MNSNFCLSLGNFSKSEDINRNIYNRNFPSKKMPISYDFRSESSKDLNMKDSTNIVNRDAIHNLNNHFNPGKGCCLGYFQVINTESELKNINKKDGCLNINIEENNKYQNNKYSTESCCNSQRTVNNFFDNQMFNKNTKAKCRK